MSKPTWDGESQTTIEWDGVILPCAGVDGLTEGDRSWCATLPMENHCVLELYVPEDAVAWVCIHPRPVDLTDEQSDIYPIMFATIEDGCIVARSPGGDTNDERLVSAILTPAWSCEVEGPDEVKDFLQRWGRLPVKRAQSVG